MKKYFTILLALTLTASTQADDSVPLQSPKSRQGEAAGYSSRNATILSMMGWGFILATGIATLCALISDNTGTSHSH